VLLCRSLSLSCLLPMRSRELDETGSQEANGEEAARRDAMPGDEERLCAAIREVGALWSGDPATVRVEVDDTERVTVTVHAGQRRVCTCASADPPPPGARLAMLRRALRRTVLTLGSELREEEVQARRFYEAALTAIGSAAGDAGRFTRALEEALAAARPEDVTLVEAVGGARQGTEASAAALKDALAALQVLAKRRLARAQGDPEPGGSGAPAAKGA